ncbi:MAG: MmcQ/YjbR family DNA-binding protein [Acetobacteraceae bacterium]|nr:MmcQ/YjbR family DNA-binding protein [Acetobacteraceae bacterium]
MAGKIKTRLDPKRLERFCLALPGATLSIQWGDHRVMKVGGKMFAVFSGDAETPYLSFKADELGFEMLTQHAGLQPAPYLARAQWVRAEKSIGMPIKDLEAYLQRAYEIVLAKLPKKTRAQVAKATTPSLPRQGVWSTERVNGCARTW